MKCVNTLRFKCVSKTWLSLIEEDSNFADLHLERSKARPGLLMVIPPRRDLNNPYRVCCELLLTANLSKYGRTAEIQSVGKEKFLSCDENHGPVNGFICFVDARKSLV